MDINAYNMPIDSVARKLETTKLNVLMYIKRGILDGYENDGSWYITESSFYKYLVSDELKNTQVCATKSCSHSCGGGCG